MSVICGDQWTVDFIFVHRWCHSLCTWKRSQTHSVKMFYLRLRKCWPELFSLYSRAENELTKSFLTYPVMISYGDPYHNILPSFPWQFACFSSILLSGKDNVRVGTSWTSLQWPSQGLCPDLSNWSLAHELLGCCLTGRRKRESWACLYTFDCNCFTGNVWRLRDHKHQVGRGVGTESCQSYHEKE